MKKLSTLFVFRGENILRTRTLAIFAIAGVLFYATTYLAQTQYIANKANADFIYKIEQQRSTIKHILVLSRYFTSTASKASPHNAVQKPTNTASLTDENNDLVAAQFYIVNARNDLRDLSLQLEFLNSYFTDNATKLPHHISEYYFTSGNIESELNAYSHASNLLSQFDLVDTKGTDALLRELGNLHQQLDRKLESLAFIYYQYLMEATYKQQKSYWLYAALIFAGFTLAVILWLLNPLIAIISKTKAVAELAVRTKTDFLTCVSHEIRTPMHAIISAIENLKSTHLNTKQSQYVSTVLSSSESLLDVINDILGYSSLEAGETLIEYEHFNLYDLVNDLIQIMSERAQIKHLNLILRFEDNTPHQIYSDYNLIRQVLYHLVSNAIKFTETGYIVVTVDTKTLTSTAASSKSNLPSSDCFAIRFAVEDTGIGIDKSRLGDIFEQFVQVHSGTTRDFGGTGLGLAICKKIVALMGGELTVGSVLGEGSTFSFMLPINEKMPSGTAHVGHNIGVAIEPIAFISDEPEFFTNTFTQLGDAGLTVHRFASEDAVSNSIEIIQCATTVVIDYFTQAASPTKLLSGLLEAANREEQKLRFICLLRKSDLELNEKLKMQGFNGVFLLPDQYQLFLDCIVKQKISAGGRFAPVYKTAGEALSKDYISGATILLVEDNRINSALAEDMLQDFGAKVLHAENGQVAVDFIKNGLPVDLILMDCMMPIMDGFEATRQIRSLPQSQHHTLPIIALTANAMVGDKERCLAAGMDAYLSKPVRKKDLQLTLNKWLSHRKPATHITPKTSVKDTATNTRIGVDTSLAANHTANIQGAVNTRELTQSASKDATSDTSLPLITVTETKTYTEPSAEALAIERKLNQAKVMGDFQENSAPQIDSASSTTNSGDSSPAVTQDAKSASDSPTPLNGDIAQIAQSETSTNEPIIADTSSAVTEPNSLTSGAIAATPSALNYLDAAAVEKARAMMKKRFNTMIEYYLEDTQNYINQLITGINDNNYGQLVVPAHTIKSSSRQMGAFTVSDLAKDIEDKARSESADFEELKVLTDQIQEQFDLSRIDFNHLLSEANEQARSVN